MSGENSNNLNNVLLGKYDDVILPKLDILEDKREKMIKNVSVAMLVWTVLFGIFSLIFIFINKDVSIIINIISAIAVYIFSLFVITRVQFVEIFKELSSVIMLTEYFKLEERTGL